MLSKRQFLAMFVGLLFYSRAFLLVNANASCDEELRQVQNTCQAYQRKVMISLREIFQDQKQCSPFPKCKNEPIEELKLTTAKLERSERNFQLLAEGKPHFKLLWRSCFLSQCHLIAIPEFQPS